MESQGVNDLGTVQENAVELVGFVGDEGGIDGSGGGDRDFFWGNRILDGFLRETYCANNQCDEYKNYFFLHHMRFVYYYNNPKIVSKSTILVWLYLFNSNKSESPETR